MANNWQEDELLLTLHLYCRTAFGKLHQTNPTNGIALNALYDKAFDRHLISFDEDFRVVLSPKIKEKPTDDIIQDYFLRYEGKKLDMPYRFYPDARIIKLHRERMIDLAV